MPDRRTPHLLLVEDEAIIALDESRRLERFGYGVSVVHSGAQAVAKATESNGIDLILMDIDLGTGIDGRQAAEEILATREVPIVFLTSHAEEDVVARVRDITRYGYVLKSSGDFVLRSSIEMAFELWEANRELRESRERYQSLFEESPVAVWVEDFSEVKRRLDALADEGVRDVASYLQDRPELVRELTQAIRVTDVNATALRVYEASNKQDLLGDLDTVFEQASFAGMVDEFVAVAEGRTALSLEKVHVTLTGRRLIVQLNWSVPPGHEETFDRVLVSITDVTELRESEADLSVTLDSIADGVVVTDPDGRIRRMNPMAQELTGWPLAEALGRPLSECFTIIDSRTRDSVADPVQHVLETGEVVVLGNHTSLIARDGAEFQIADAASPIRSNGGPILGAVLVFRDVSESYAVREALRKSESQLARAQRLAGLGSWEFDFTANRVYASAEAHRIYGLPEGELTIETAQSVPLPEYRPILDAAFRDLVTKGHPYDVEFEIRRASDGAIRVVHSLAEYDAEKRVLIGILRDITEEKALRLELRRESERLHAMLHFGDLAWWEMDVTDGTVTFSDEKVTMLGYQPDAFTHYSDFTTLLHANDHDRGMSSMTAHLEGRAPHYDVEYRILAADGSYRWCRDTGSISSRNRDGSPRTVTGVVRDTDHQRRTEEEARRSEEWFRKVVENANDIVYTLDFDGVFTYVSPAWRHMLGHEPGQVLGTSFEKYVHPEDIPACRDFLSTVTEEGTPKAGVEYRVWHRDGSIRVHASNAAPLWDETGAVSGYLGIARDITETREARERIRALLQDKELLLREVHHRVKNNLTTVAGLLTLQAETQESEEVARALKDAEGRVRTMVQIYQTLFQAGTYQTVSVATFLESLLSGTVETFGEGVISLQMDITDIQVPTGYSLPIGLIANELVTNAFKHAFAPGARGTVRVRVGNREGRIEIVVEDDGAGLPEGIGPGSSSGFGLELVGAEVRQLHADLDIDRRDGTRFTVRIPFDGVESAG